VHDKTNNKNEEEKVAVVWLALTTQQLFFHDNALAHTPPCLIAA